MDTNRTARITNIIEKRQPLARNIEGVEANLRSLFSGLAHLESCRQQTMTRVDDPSVKGQLEEIKFSAIQLKLDAEIEALSKLKVRFSRNTNLM